MSGTGSINLWNWALWASPEPVPETVLNPEAMLKLMVKSVAPDAEAFDDYVQTNGNIESLHAMCEDYRAGAGIDSEHDAADAGTKIDPHPTLETESQVMRRSRLLQSSSRAINS